MAGAIDRYSPLAAIQPYHRPAIRKIDAFIRDLGGGDVKKGRERFLACLLLTAHSDERLDYLLQLTEDPDHQARSVGDLAIIAGFRAGELIKILKETGLLVAQAHATQIVADHLPAVVQDIVTRAQNHYTACDACDGTGSVTPDPTKDKPNPEPEPCRACKGKGQLLIPADADRQDRVLEMARMLPESKGTQIGVGVNVGTKTHADGALSAGSFGMLFSQLVAATDRIQHPDRSRATGSTLSVQSPPPHAPFTDAPDSSPVDGVVVSPDELPPPSPDA